MTPEEAHHYFAIACNQRVWQLLAKPDKTAEENDELINSAHASLLHWTRSPQYGPVNFQRGEYLIAITYAHTGRGEPALYHARQCYHLTKNNPPGTQDFDFAYAALAMGVALALSGADAAPYLAEAERLGHDLGNAEDKRIFWEDFRFMTG